MTIISASLPGPLVEQMDALIASRGFAGRSELLRAALREFVNRETLAATDATTARTIRSATLTLLYPEGSEKRVADVRHEYSEIVKSMMHAHTESHCVEVFILQGSAPRIREFADRLRTHKDAQLVQITYTDVGEPAAGGPPAHAHGAPGHTHR